MGVVGVRIHQLKDQNGQQSSAGRNPFEEFSLGNTSLSAIAKLHESPYADSKFTYAHISQYRSSWIEEAIIIRNAH